MNGGGAKWVKGWEGEGVSEFCCLHVKGKSGCRAVGFFGGDLVLIVRLFFDW